MSSKLVRKNKKSKKNKNDFFDVNIRQAMMFDSISNGTKKCIIVSASYGCDRFLNLIDNVIVHLIENDYKVTPRMVDDNIVAFIDYNNNYDEEEFYEIQMEIVGVFDKFYKMEQRIEKLYS